MRNHGLQFGNVAKCLLFIEKFSWPCEIMGMVFIIFVELWVAFSNMYGIMGLDFESKWHSIQN